MATDPVQRRLDALRDVAGEIHQKEAELERLRGIRDRLALQLNHDDGVPLRKLAPIARTTDSYLSTPRIEERLLRRERARS